MLLCSLHTYNVIIILKEDINIYEQKINKHKTASFLESFTFKILRLSSYNKDNTTNYLVLNFGGRAKDHRYL